MDFHIDFRSVNEDPDKTDQRIGELKESVLKEDGLKVPDDRSFYLRFLRAGLSSPRDGLDIIKNYFLLRKNYFKYFKVCENKARTNKGVSDLFTECNRLRQAQRSVQPANSMHAARQVRQEYERKCRHLYFRDELGRRIYVFRPGRWDPDKVDLVTSGVVQTMSS